MTASVPEARDAQETADRLAIYELYARYAQAVDLEDGDAYAACFTEDGWTDISSFSHTVESFRALGLDCLDETGKVRGRTNLRASSRVRRARTGGGRGGLAGCRC